MSTLSDPAETPSGVIDAAEVDAQHALPSASPCDACGAPRIPEDRYCSACGAPFVADDKPSPADAKPASTTQLRCDTCSAELAVDDSNRSTTCPFCDSTYVVELPQTPDRETPEFVIGFAVTRQQAEKQFRAWLGKGGLFVPGDLKQVALTEKVRGVYVPFWSFAARAESTWRARIGEYWYKTENYVTRNSKGKMVTRTRRVRKTEWWPLAGRHHRFYSGYFIPAGGGLTQEEANQIQPYQLPSLARYRPAFLAGWLTEQYTVAPADAWQRCQSYFRQREQQNIAAFLPGDTHRDLQVATQLEKISTELVLLPIHIFSYRYQDQVYRFLINGQTGRAVGKKPVSKTRIAIAVAIGVLLFVIVASVIALLAGGGV